MLRAAVAILVLLSASLLDARQAAVGTAAPVPQNPQDTRPARDPKKPKDTGTARIRGRVIGGETGAPLRRATVQLTGEGIEGGRDRQPPTTTARYEIKDLPASRVRLTASKGGYVRCNTDSVGRSSRAARWTSGTGRLIETDFNLPRGGVHFRPHLPTRSVSRRSVRGQCERWLYTEGKRQLHAGGGTAPTTWVAFESLVWRPVTTS